ncbi:MAG: hypothetical protein KatS3mg092_0201 [Patescibacteria group bacterium]|nr:MAG: hypothetical protein KatS3mg092_0201 [Patescibacteria group bacterium]
MRNNVFLEKSKIKFHKNQPTARVEFISFVADQFKKIVKKNLQIPVTLYHL